MESRPYLSNPDRNRFRYSVVDTAIRTGSSKSISGVETLLFLAKLSPTHFYDTNEVINTVNHTQHHILIWREWGHDRICLRHPTRACVSSVQWCGLVHWRPLLFARTHVTVLRNRRWWNFQLLENWRRGIKCLMEPLYLNYLMIMAKDMRLRHVKESLKWYDSFR